MIGDVDGDGRADPIFVGRNWNGSGLSVRTKLSNEDGTWCSVYQVLGDGPETQKYRALLGEETSG
jgi:hypothetical protein